MDRIYCYPETDILINKLNIRDADKLKEAEKKLSSMRIVDLLERPIQGTFDMNHLQMIHRYIFQDIYTWAGEIRTVDIAKSNLFCKVEFISMQSDELFLRLKKEHYLKTSEQGDLVKKLAYYFSEINALHPFREGNGRTQREFIRELALYNGITLRFANISESDMVEASKESFVCKYEKMEELFKRCME